MEANLHFEAELNNFIHELRKENQTEEIVLDILRLLEEKVLTKDLLQRTNIGVVLSEVKNFFQSNEEIVGKCGSLLKSWKEIIRSEKNNNTNKTKVSIVQNSGNENPDQERDDMSDGDGEDNDGERKVAAVENMQDTNPTHPTQLSPPSELRNQTYTITFGDQAENHVGMQKIGSLSSEGFSLSDLQRAKVWFEERGKICEIVALHESLPTRKQQPSLEAYVLIAREGVSAILNTSSSPTNDLMLEQFNLPKDTQAFMYGRVVQKHARYNLCFSSFDQEPDYSNGKGRVVCYDRVPLLKTIRETLGEIIGDKGRNLEAEGNYYYDISKCGIGYHGDTERRKVIALRMGESIPLYYVWYENSKPISDRIRINLHHGDIYFMSEKSTGQDWKKKIIPTLRHATGVEKFVKLST